MKRPTIDETARAEAAARKPAKKGKKQTPDRTRIMGVRFTPDEYTRLQAFFEAQGIPVATGVRMLALNHLRDHGA